MKPVNGVFVKALVVLGVLGAQCLAPHASAQEDGVVEVTSNDPAAIAFSPDKVHFAASGRDNSVSLWNLATKTKRLLHGHTKTVQSICFSDGGKTLLGSGENGVLHVWDVATGNHKQQVVVNDGPVASMRHVVSPDGKWLATSATIQTRFPGFEGDGEVRIWDAKTMKPTHTLFRVPGCGNGLAFTPDSKSLTTVIVAEPGTGGFTGIKVWDVETGVEQRKLQPPERCVGLLAFSPDGKLLVTGGSIMVSVNGRTTSFGQLTILEYATGNIDRALDNPSGGFEAVAFTHDGKHLITGKGGPGRLRPGGWSVATGVTDYWKVDTGNKVWSVERACGICDVVVSPNGDIIGVGDFSGIRFIDAKTGTITEELQIAKLVR